MLRFIINAEHALTLLPYLERWAQNLAKHVDIVTYDELFRSVSLPLCTHIFTDIELLSSEEREHAFFFWDALDSADMAGSLLNHPLRVLRRYDLLRRLREVGRNDFDLYRLGEARKPQRFPVFIRKENDHLGPETGLIGSQDELNSVLEQMIRAGKSSDGRVIVEYCAEAGSDGVFRKYGAFYVAGTVIPRHMLFADDWLVKGRTKHITEETLAEERRYLTENPHASEIRAVFDAVHIDYGRIDYGFVEGRMQVFEINTNPTIVNEGAHKRTDKLERFTSELTSAFLPLAGLDGDNRAPRGESLRLNPPLKDFRARLASRFCDLLFGRQFRARR